MIPILYEKTETAFSSNGLGRLSDCIRCIVIEERNGIFECEFDYPVTGVLFSEIQEGRVVACTHDEQGDVQPFDIYARSEPINGVVTFYAHHISYRLSEITVKPFTAGSCVEALQKIKSQSVNPNPFTFWTDKSVTADYVSDHPKNAKGMLAGEEGSIIDVFGTGEYEFDKFNVKLHLHRGQDTNVSIRYGKNLIDYTNKYDVSDAYTAVVPYWLGNVSEGEETVSRLVMLTELFITSGHSVPSGREVVVPMNLSGDFSEPPTEGQLRALATSRLENSDAWLPNQTVTVDFIQLWKTDEYKDFAPLQRLRLCDTCGIFVPMYNTSVRAKVIRTEYNVLLDRYDRMELGDKPTTYASVIEKMYDSKVADVKAGLQSVGVDIKTIATTTLNDARTYSDGKLASAVLEINADIADLQSQIDGNITSWFFDTNPSMTAPPVAYDPDVEGSGWDTDEKKDQHLGDLYYNTATGYVWRFVKENGTYSWSAISDSGVTEALRLASEAKDIADAKRRIFYSQPVPPYDDGDLWTQGANGDILRCAVPKTASETFAESDWVKASKYTDNSALTAFINGTFADTVTSIEGQLDRKAETWYQSEDPSTDWQTTEQKNDHIGDLWYYTGADSGGFEHNATYRWNGTAWQAQTIPTSVFDMIDGKSNIFVGTNTPTGNLENGDLWFQGQDKPILTYVNGGWAEYNYYIDSSVSQAQVSQAIVSAKQTIHDEYMDAIDDATELIRGGTGGYVVTTVNANGQPIELLITDNLNLNQAVNVWRWNQGGLAHSSNGYAGPFSDVAITSDGKINASMILTGVLSANLITAGTITDSTGKNYWNLDSGQFVTKQGTIGPYSITNSGLTSENTGSRGNRFSLTAYGLKYAQKGVSSISSVELAGYYGYGGQIIFSGKYGSNIGYDELEEITSFRTEMMYDSSSSEYYGNLAIFNNGERALTINPPNWPIRAYFSGDTRIVGSLTVTGTKPRLIETPNYGERLNYCYETPTPLFGDIGEAQLDSDGICYVDIDDIFSETIELRQEYQVFLQKEGEGDCWVAEKQKRYFVIQGTPNLKVAWELKAKQRDYDMIRLEQPESGLDEYEHTTDNDTLLDSFINEQEELLYG